MSWSRQQSKSHRAAVEELQVVLVPSLQVEVLRWPLQQHAQHDHEASHRRDTYHKGHQQQHEVLIRH